MGKEPEVAAQDGRRPRRRGGEMSRHCDGCNGWDCQHEEACDDHRECPGLPEPDVAGWLEKQAADEEAHGDKFSGAESLRLMAARIRRGECGGKREAGGDDATR